jgi:hypothetical protein
MAKSRQTARKTPTQRNKTKTDAPAEPSPRDLIRKPDLTASVRLRFDCALFVRVTHPEYLPHEVMALVRQGQVQMDPLPPGQVGTLILDGFPYTVLGYYTFLEQDAAYQDGPAECSFHGPFYDFYLKKAAAFQDMAQATGDAFEKARQETRQLRDRMAKREGPMKARRG